MRMVEESKNERLTTLLEKTNELLVRLGAAVQRQKDAEHFVTVETQRDSESESEAPADLRDADMSATDSASILRAKDLLEGQKQYDSAVHSIQEKVNTCSSSAFLFTAH